MQRALCPTMTTCKNDRPLRCADGMCVITISECARASGLEGLKTIFPQVGNALYILYCSRRSKLNRAVKWYHHPACLSDNAPIPHPTCRRRT